MLMGLFGGGLSANPRIEMSADTANANVGDLITFIAKPFDISGAVTQVVWKVDGTTVATITDFSAAVEYQTNQLTEGAHTITTETSYFSSSTNQIETISKDLAITISAVQTTPPPTPTTTIPWESNFTQNLDDDGWTIFAPTANSNIYYVDSSMPDDTAGAAVTLASLPGGTWDNPTGITTAYKTVNAAMAAARDGENDYVLLKRGQEFEVVSGFDMKSGIDNSNRFVLASYGDTALDRPLINGNLTTDTNIVEELAENTIIADIHFTSHRRNPNHVDFGGWFDMEPVGGIFDFNPSFVRQNMTIEGCKFSYLSQAVRRSTDTKERVANFAIRRNVVEHMFNISKELASFGFFLNGYNQSLVEENTLYKCGFFDKYSHTLTFREFDNFESTLTVALTTDGVVTLDLADAAPHLLSADDGVEIFRDSGSSIKTEVLSMSGNQVTIPATNFAADNASIGNTIRIRRQRGEYGQVAAETASVLNSAGTNQIPINLPLTGNYQAGMKITFYADDGFEYALPLTSMGSSVINIDSTDFSAHPVSSGRTIILHVAGSSILNHHIYQTQGYESIFRNNVFIEPSSIGIKQSSGDDSYLDIYVERIAIYGNIFIGGEAATSIGGNADAGEAIRFNEIVVRDNFLIDIGINDLTDRGVAYGINCFDNQHSIYQYNRAFSRNLAAQQYAVGHGGLASNVIAADNISYGLGSSAFTNGSSIDQTVQFVGNILDDASHASWMTIPQFLTSIGESGDIEEFATVMLNRDKQNWHTHDTTYKNQLVTDTPVTNDYRLLVEPLSLELADGTEAVFTADVYAGDGATFQWYDGNDVAVNGETGRVLRVTASDTTDGNAYYLRTSLDETDYDTAQAVLTLQTSQVVSITGAESITFDFDGASTLPITQGMVVEYYYQSNTATSRNLGLGNGSSNEIVHRQSQFNWDLATDGDENFNTVNSQDGLPHLIRHVIPAAGETSKTYVDGNLGEGMTYASNGQLGLNAITMNASYSHGDASIWDLKIYASDGTTLLYHFALDSGAHSGATESALVGTASAILNVPSTAWSS